MQVMVISGVSLTFLSANLIFEVSKKVICPWGMFVMRYQDVLKEIAEFIDLL